MMIFPPVSPHPIFLHEHQGAGYRSCIAALCFGACCSCVCVVQPEEPVIQIESIRQ